MGKTTKFTLEQAQQKFSTFGWELLDNFYSKNDYPHNAKCKCGNPTKKRLNDLKKYPGCRMCGKNYIPTVDELKKEYLERGCEFLDNFYINAHYLHTYKCKCGNVSQININNWRMGKRCKTCGNVIVFDPKLPSNVYLAERDGQLKIGINNRKSWRLVTHKRNGWLIIDKLGPITGYNAKSIEKTILDCLRNKNIKLGNQLFKERFDGYSECWLKSDFPVTSLTDLWDKL